MKKAKTIQYTCNEYREEMILLALQTRLAGDITSVERESILAEIAELEKQMGLD